MTDTYENITGDGPTLRMLERIQKSHSLIHVRLNEKTNPWSSTVIAINYNSHTWSFDELSSAEGHRLLLKERYCNIETRLSGIIIKFRAEISNSRVDSQGLGYYESPPPKSIRVYQRREDFRATIQSSQRATMTFIIPGGTMMRGRLRDISIGGVGVEFNNWTPLIESGLYIHSSTISFPDTQSISCELKICSVRRSYFGMSIGANFIKISKEAQQQIAKLVTILDRESAQRNRLKVS